jgi:O-antigen/teichoic acid export membrane protein
VKTIKILFLNSTAQIFGKLASSLTTLFISGIVARSLGEDGYGQFAIMTTYSAAFYMASDFGFNAVALRLIEGDSKKLKDHFEKLLGLRVIYSLVLIALAAAILNFFPYSGTLKLATIVTCLTILTQAIYNTANLIFQARLRYGLSTLALLAGSLVNLGMIYLLSQGSINLLLVATTYVVGGVALVISSLGLARALIGKFTPQFDWGEYKKLSLLTLPVGLTLVFDLVYFRADTFILSFLKSTSDVGVYGAAYKLFEIALTPPTFFLNALYPILIAKLVEDHVRFKSLIRYSILGLATVSLIGAAVGVILAPTIIKLVYGDGFDDSVLPFRLLIASAPIFYLSSLYMWLLILLKKQNVMFVVYALGMLANILLNIYFIPHFTYLASAILTGVSEGGILLATFWLARDWKNLSKPTIEEEIRG